MAATATLFFEYEAVMTRAEHLTAAGLSIEDVCVLLDRLAKAIVPVRVSFAWRPQTEDANDDMVLEAAVNGQANARTFAGAAARFGIGVLTPAAA